MSDGVRDLREIIRDEMIMADIIIDSLREGPKTIPEIASAIGRPAHEVLIWVMGLRRYGRISEATEMTDDGYYRYSAAGEGD
ncbi:MAG: MarR family transcriptional regulator [Bacillota bacterium]